MNVYIKNITESYFTFRSILNGKRFNHAGLYRFFGNNRAVDSILELYLALAKKSTYEIKIMVKF